MIRERRTRVLCSLAFVSLVLLSGCREFMAAAARDSLAGFINSIVTTAVDETINPTDD